MQNATQPESPPEPNLMSESLIIHTRYRDIDWQDIVAGLSRGELHRRVEWESVRGKPVALEGPPVDAASRAQPNCGGPFYRVINPIGDWPGYVCPHLAEIGD